MEQNNQKKEYKPMSYGEIFDLLRAKLKLIVCITLVAAILGGAASLLSIVFFGHHGTTVSFYLTPADNTQSLLSLLKSESFSEKLLLDENGLPPKAECNAEDYDKALAAVLAENAARERKQEARKALDLIPYSFALIQERHGELQATYNEIYNLLNIYKSAYQSDHESHAEKISEYEAKLAVAADAMHKYEDEYFYPAVQEKLAIEQEYAEAAQALKDARKESAELTEKVLAPWRENEDVQKNIEILQDNITFEYEKITTQKESSSSTSEVNNYGFLTISVSIPEDEEFAEQIVENIKAFTSEYVEKNVERLTGASEAQCSIISPHSQVRNLDAEGFIVKCAIFAIGAGAVALVVTCVVIVLSNMAKSYLASKKEEEPAEDKE